MTFPMLSDYLRPALSAKEKMMKKNADMDKLDMLCRGAKRDQKIIRFLLIVVAVVWLIFVAVLVPVRKISLNQPNVYALAAVIFLLILCGVAQCGGPGILIEKIRDWARRKARAERRRL